MAATIGPGGPFMAREIAIAGAPGPISAADHPLRDSTLRVDWCVRVRVRV